MNKQRMRFEAVDRLCGATEESVEDPLLYRRRIGVAVESSWQDGMTLDELVKAARRKLGASDMGVTMAKEQKTAAELADLIFESTGLRVAIYADGGHGFWDADPIHVDEVDDTMRVKRAAQDLRVLFDLVE